MKKKKAHIFKISPSPLPFLSSSPSSPSLLLFLFSSLFSSSSFLLRIEPVRFGYILSQSKSAGIFLSGLLSHLSVESAYGGNSWSLICILSIILEAEINHPHSGCHNRELWGTEGRAAWWGGAGQTELSELRKVYPSKATPLRSGRRSEPLGVGSWESTCGAGLYSKCTDVTLLDRDTLTVRKRLWKFRQYLTLAHPASNKFLQSLWLFQNTKK